MGHIRGYNGQHTYLVVGHGFSDTLIFFVLFEHTELTIHLCSNQCKLVYKTIKHPYTLDQLPEMYAAVASLFYYYYYYCTASYVTRKVKLRIIRI